MSDNPMNLLRHVQVAKERTYTQFEVDAMLREAQAEAYERCAKNMVSHPHFAGVFLEWAAVARKGER